MFRSRAGSASISAPRRSHRDELPHRPSRPGCPLGGRFIRDVLLAVGAPPNVAGCPLGGWKPRSRPGGGAAGVGPGPGAGRMDRVPPGRTACTATAPSFCRPSSGTSGAESRALIRGSRCWWGRTLRRLRRRSGSSMKSALLAPALLGSIEKCGGGAVHLWSMHQFVQEHGEAAPHDTGRASGEALSGRGAGGHDRRGRFVRFLWKGAGRPSG